MVKLNDLNSWVEKFKQNKNGKYSKEYHLVHFMVLLSLYSYSQNMRLQTQQGIKYDEPQSSIIKAFEAVEESILKNSTIIANVVYIDNSSELKQITLQDALSYLQMRNGVTISVGDGLNEILNNNNVDNIQFSQKGFLSFPKTKRWSNCCKATTIAASVICALGAIGYGLSYAFSQ